MFPVTDPNMTRFKISLQGGVNMVIHAFEPVWCRGLFVPKIPSYIIMGFVEVIGPDCEKTIIGIYPVENIHEEVITSSYFFNTNYLFKYYSIIPQVLRFKLEDYIEQNKAKLIEQVFRYN